MKTRCTQLLVGVALSACGPYASAATAPYAATFDTSAGPEWSLVGAAPGSALPLSQTNPGSSNSSLLHTQFLGDFGGTDNVKLHLTLPQNISSVTLAFDVYMLRTWDGNDSTPIANPRPNEPDKIGGPDIFGYRYNGNTILEASFSHGAGRQTYCVGPNRGIDGAGTCQAPANGYLHDPTFDYGLLNKLGFKVLLDPHDITPGVPQIGDEMSMAYHLTSTIPYTGGDITFDFFSKGLQVHDPQLDGVPRLSDESWGLDNVTVNVTSVPEPRTWTLLFAGLLFSTFAATRRSRLQR